MEWQSALQRLKDGNQRFTSDTLQSSNADASARADLTGGQAPYAIILSCADSRVVPELAFDTGLGEIFVVRVAGNVANKSSLASIEYAVAHLGTSLIVVMGHQSCGAVTAALAGGDNGENLNHLISHILQAVDVSDSSDVNEVVKTNAKINAELIFKNSQIIPDVAKERDLKVVPAYYNLDSGKVDFLE